MIRVQHALYISFFKKNKQVILPLLFSELLIGIDSFRDYHILCFSFPKYNISATRQSI